MAKPRDKVHLLKQEFVSTGGDAADETGAILGECPLEPNEDAPEVQGIFFQPPTPSTVVDEEVWIGRDDSGNMCFRDENTPETPLSALFGLPPLEKFVYTTDLCIVIVGCDFVTTEDD